MVLGVPKLKHFRVSSASIVNNCLAVASAIYFFGDYHIISIASIVNGCLAVASVSTVL